MSARFCLLFDLDGTLVDTDPLHFLAYQDFMAAQGRNIDLEEYHSSVMGNPNAQIMSHFFPGETVERHMEFADDKESRFRAKLREVEPTLGLKDLLNWASAHDCPFAVVTNAPRSNAELMLNALGIADRFDHLVIGEELAHSKPHPLPYLTGLQLLGGDAARAVAFEDSVSGIKAAVAAGIHTIGIRTSLSDEKLLAAGAARVISDFHDPDLLAWLEKQIA